MNYSSKQNYPPKTRHLPMPVEAKQIYELSEQSWNVLTEVTFPTAKTPEAIMMALDYCRTRWCANTCIRFKLKAIVTNFHSPVTASRPLSSATLLVLCNIVMWDINQLVLCEFVAPTRLR